MIVSQFLAENGDQINPKWDLELAELARIIKQEAAHRKRIDQYNTSQQIKEARRKAKRRPGTF